MTTNEIKTLIQNTIAGQGSQVDIGGKLAEILSAIVDAIPSGETARPIVLSSVPDTADSLDDLAERGLTIDEIKAAASGMRDSVVVDEAGEKRLYQIIDAYEAGQNFGIIFAYFSFSQSGVSIVTQYSVTIAGTSLFIDYVSIE